MSYTSPLLYMYGLNVKFSSVASKTPLNELFPHVEDLMISSRDFDKFEEAIQSCNGVVTEITSFLNLAVGETKYKTVSELNPRLTGQQTLSKEWSQHEIAKLWIVDNKSDPENPGAGIVATALAQVMEVPQGSVQVS
jgi:hypothetical protein